MHSLRKKLSPEFWVSTLVLLAMLVGVVVWSEAGKASGAEEFNLSVYKKAAKKPARR